MTKTRIDRRSFLRTTAVGAGCILAGKPGFASQAAEHPVPPVAVFSKVYQELKLDFAQSAEVTAEAGLEGIDCAVRPGGEILPEDAAKRMPQYAQALAKRGLRILLATTAIQGVSSPHAREILETSKTLGMRYYRLGFWNHRPGLPPEQLYARIESSLKELAALNRELGLCALFQNHSSPNPKTAYVGSDLAEMYRIVKNFHPDQLAVAFDLGHAIIAHGDQWRSHFDQLKKHIRVVYVKDMRRPSQFVPFGQGEFGRTNFFRLLAEMNYHAPLSMHVEYDWAPDGKKTRALLVETLKRNRRVLGQWWTDKPA